MREQTTADVLVIGAGIIGAATAFRLAERGLRVALLEAQAAPAMGSTGRSAAGVRVQFTEEVNVRLSWESIQEYRAFPEVYGEASGYRPIGYLFLVPEAAWARHRAGVALQRRLGAPVQVLQPKEAQAIVAFVPEGIAGATYGPADGVVDPHCITHAYLRLARARGARLYLETPLLEARHERGVWRARTPHAWFEAPYIVNAAGAWAGEVARRAGLEIPVWPVRRTVFVTGPLSEPHTYPLTVDLASGVYFRSEGERLLFGRSNPAEPPGFREGVDWGWLEPTLEAALARFPWFAGLSLDRRACWWGYYEVTPDHNPILGRMPGVPGWVNAAGFSGHGVQQAAAVGRVIAEEIVDGRAHSIDVDPLRYERFQTGNTRTEAHIV